MTKEKKKKKKNRKVSHDLNLIIKTIHYKCLANSSTKCLLTSQSASCSAPYTPGLLPPHSLPHTKLHPARTINN
jgi:hypothetical protein